MHRNLSRIAVSSPGPFNFKKLLDFTSFFQDLLRNLAKSSENFCDFLKNITYIKYYYLREIQLNDPVSSQLSVINVSVLKLRMPRSESNFTDFTNFFN